MADNGARGGAEDAERGVGEQKSEGKGKGEIPRCARGDKREGVTTP